MCAIPQFTSVPKEPVSSSGNQGVFFESHTSRSPIIENINGHSSVPDGGSFALIPYIGRDCDFVLLEEPKFRQRLWTEYGPSTLYHEINELEDIMSGFNGLFTKTRFYNGFFLNYSEENERTKVKRIPLNLPVNARNVVGHIENVLSEECPPHEKENERQKRVESLKAKNKKVNSLYLDAVLPLYAAISDSHLSAVKRAGEELDRMRTDFDEYESGLNDWLEGLALMDNMNDDKMDALINENNVIYQNLCLSRSLIIDGCRSSLKPLQRFNEDLDSFLWRLLHNRYELNKILAVSHGALKHIFWNGVETLASIAGSATGPIGGIPVSAAFTYMTTAIRQGVMDDAYWELNLEHGESPFDEGEALMNAGISVAAQAAGPLVGKIPVVKQAVNRVIKKPAGRFLKSVKGLFEKRISGSLVDEASKDVAETASEVTLAQVKKQVITDAVKGSGKKISGRAANKLATRVAKQFTKKECDRVIQGVAENLVKDVFDKVAKETTKEITADAYTKAFKEMTDIVAGKVLKEVDKKYSNDILKDYVLNIAYESLKKALGKTEKEALSKVAENAAKRMEASVTNEYLENMAKIAAEKAVSDSARKNAAEVARKAALEAIKRESKENAEQAAMNAAKEAAKESIKKDATIALSRAMEKELQRTMKEAAGKLFKRHVAGIVDTIASEAFTDAVLEAQEKASRKIFLESVPKVGKRLVSFSEKHPYIQSVIEPEYAKMSYSMMSLPSARYSAKFVGTKLLKSKPLKYMGNEFKGEFEHDFNDEDMGQQQE